MIRLYVCLAEDFGDGAGAIAISGDYECHTVGGCFDVLTGNVVVIHASHCAGISGTT